MGNCLKHQSSTNKYDGSDHDSDDWDFLAGEEGSFAATKAKTVTEVKIKITKKQLEELLSKVDVRELRVEQVLSQLMNHSSGGFQSLQRPWRPALQSIPEAN
ncbi:hypothetical protein AAZX31_18G094000 [Glycine max]|uniref:DUF4228 domain protein n=2 Tax=Glycine subgen. Soja TaxID=1462606 RepID=I1N0P3_SOYBN|nr:uncharacterized protein LOC100791945 [Glycine max]XP_028213546.1 uncharacterized protein LOC114395877 [Glycine soja]XP_028213547.1 uncharacterized protein LOC114395877 [Glycine soja]KAG4920854.1 hypothetical protein JHK86_049667 [Glycine max]KAG4923927.1 hypothetical protein JHK87_049467 [Glycine soja]KAG4935493.1 hypothetical protein JHK85_050412 [Glycine max]KAH1153900.1 hypothetical protein GYH30_049505 [Glycine max]KAH1197426.1 hypothetical protein GmHk_18G051216 [Glycine max]|eukprot:XP_003551883.1 uncharacterized protein LOC100791945 [Glycine max]